MLKQIERKAQRNPSVPVFDTPRTLLQAFTQCWEKYIFYWKKNPLFLDIFLKILIVVIYFEKWYINIQYAYK